MLVLMRFGGVRLFLWLCGLMVDFVDRRLLTNVERLVVMYI